MGVGASVPKKEALRFVKTLEGKDVNITDLLNKIFSWMLEKSDLLDYYALASPSECKLYVKSTEDALSMLFKTIQVQPEQDSKTGKIFFQKISTLKQIADGIQTTDDRYRAIAEPAQKRMCTQIAYYYLRILQIYSALALSVLDVSIPENYDSLRPPTVSTRGEKQKGRPLLLQDIQARPLAPQQGGQLSVSSRLFIKNQNYSLLNKYLVFENKPQGVELIDGTKRSGIYIPANYIELLNQGKITALQLNAKLKNVNEDTSVVNAVLRMSIQELEKDAIGLPTINYTAEFVSIKLDGTELTESQLASMGLKKATFRVIGTNYHYGKQTLSQWIIGIFKKAVGFDVDEDDYQNSAGVRAGVSVGVKKERKSTSDLPSDFPEETYGLKKISSILKDSKPKAYCVSRALQLLSPEHIYKDLDSSARTYICNSSFALSDSSPILGKPITDVKGIFYLDRLFYDKIVKSSPAISEQLVPQHEKFMSELKALYEQQTETVRKNENISKITEKPASFCKTKGMGVHQTKDRETIRNLREFVGKLLNRQIQHTSNVIKLLSELFIISTSDPLQIQPSIWKKGMPEIERIATRARELLTEYYNDCETTYQEGTLYISKRADKFDV